MLCQDCKKKDAKVHLTQIVNNEKVTLNLCKDCADKKGFNNPFEVQVFPLTELLQKIHGTAVHKGKSPQIPTGDLLKGWQEEKKLQDELRKAIEKEDFEKAAQIRDQIKTMISKN